MTINTYFMWDGVEPEEGSDQIDIPWRHSQQEAEEHMAAIAEVIARANPDIVNLVEIENEAALTTLNDRFLAGRGYRPYFVQGGDTFTGQDVGLLTRVDPEGDQILFDDREGQSGNVRKSVSKNYNAVITVGDTKILLVGRWVCTSWRNRTGRTAGSNARRRPTRSARSCWRSVAPAAR
jgi:hypothetical protein